MPAVTIIDYEKENHLQHIEALAALDKKAGSTPVFYSWVNATCHPEWLKFFDVDQF